MIVLEIDGGEKIIWNLSNNLSAKTHVRKGLLGRCGSIFLTLAMDMTTDYHAIIFMMKKKLCINARIICVIYDLKYHEIFFLFET